MTHPLVIESSTHVDTGCAVVVEDYDRHPALCRSGIWVGERCDFRETVVLSFEHDPDPLYAGWAINGTTLIDPGLSPGTSPWGDPVPAVAGVTYVCPYLGFYHKIALTGTAGMSQVCPWVQVLYRPITANPTDPAQLGPGMYVCIDGFRIDWPADKLAEWQACIVGLMERLRGLEQIAHIGPGDPVEQWLERGDPEAAFRLGAMVDALETLHPERDRGLKAAVEAEIRVTIERFRQTDLLTKASPERT
ncbi:MAG: hypothetical protein M3024_12295 [Candidatus Dormibacteraeota bacterium]|nr:hypothetical protein [Candidatus Dormibacteraeota bacterium]